VVDSLTLVCTGAAGTWCRNLVTVPVTVTVTDLRPGGTATAVVSIEVNFLPGKNSENSVR
jgi:hypothetical protein